MLLLFEIAKYKRNNHVRLISVAICRHSRKYVANVNNLTNLLDH